MGGRCQTFHASIFIIAVRVARAGFIRDDSNESGTEWNAGNGGRSVQFTTDWRTEVTSQWLALEVQPLSEVRPLKSTIHQKGNISLDYFYSCT